ncbi:uncharacterized protein LOC111000060 isoform X2 [Pieris rapae]|uniref:uncharacterized protein LOC111000060 isoform X2 n=1 Tax=Pieris rapae TaxID=64459 RepID=UPI001E27B7D2|nr:uncharacterized protein LOC111000060 isoform X2 [Pieris rapae]
MINQVINNNQASFLSFVSSHFTNTNCCCCKNCAKYCNLDKIVAKMIMKRNLLESVTIISCCSTLLCVLFNYTTNISPLTGYWFVAYTIILLIASIIFSVKIIQWLLHLNKPLKYDLEFIIEKYPFSAFFVKVLPLISKNTKTLHDCKEYDTNELSVITSVLERKLVSSWYIHYISQEISFPFACKQMLDQMISKAFQISNKIESKDVYVDICAILISHLKEYKNALKRHEKPSEKSLESLYKKVHEISDIKNKNTAVADHCINIMRLVLKELVPWELWDTPHSELIVRILAKKLDDYVNCTISNPVWLNDKILSILTPPEDVPDKKTMPHTKVEKKDLSSLQEDEIAVQATQQPEIKDISNSPSIIKDNIKATEENDKCIEAKEILTTTEPVEIKSVLRQRRGRQGKNEVKIYDRVIEGSVKTWETDMDLQCISMGQDLLASLDELTLSRLWGHEELETIPNMRGISPQPLWFGEEDAIDLDPEPAKETKSSPKAADALLKDIQSTVNQAKSKIGDLQDEAAGMMEGLLDKGIAGIKKGLRFTGLSDDSQEKSPSHQREKLSPTERRGKLELVTEHRDIKEYAPKDDNCVPQLVKQQRLASQDSSSQARPCVEAGVALSESPEPQYEEAADLSHSIAKLRSLLNEAAPRNEEIWWETAEETRGRTQTHHSERHVDTATLADEYDMNLERNASPTQTPNNMQRLDRLFQRTVTGVFNSIKTAVGADGEGEVPHKWTYVTTNVDTSVGNAVSRLLGSRRALAHVDAALDSLQQLPSQAHPDDDLEEWTWASGVWCAACEVLCELGLLEDHVSFRLATLLLADVAETLICSWLVELTAWMRQQLFAVFERMSESETEPQTPETLRKFDVDETCRIILEKIPETYIFGEEKLSRAVRLLVTSFSHESINRDVVFRTIDVFAQHFINSAAFKNISFDAN